MQHDIIWSFSELPCNKYLLSLNYKGHNTLISSLVILVMFCSSPSTPSLEKLCGNKHIPRLLFFVYKSGGSWYELDFVWWWKEHKPPKLVVSSLSQVDAGVCVAYSFKDAPPSPRATLGILISERDLFLKRYVFTHLAQIDSTLIWQGFRICLIMAALFHSFALISPSPPSFPKLTRPKENLSTSPQSHYGFWKEWWGGKTSKLEYSSM